MRTTKGRLSFSFPARTIGNNFLAPLCFSLYFSKGCTALNLFCSTSSSFLPTLNVTVRVAGSVWTSPSSLGLDRWGHPLCFIRGAKLLLNPHPIPYDYIYTSLNNIVSDFRIFSATSQSIKAVYKARMSTERL